MMGRGRGVKGYLENLQKVIRSDRPLGNTLSVKLYIQDPQCYSICRIIFSLQNNWTLEYVLKCDERSVCTTHFLIATIIGQILSLTWGKSSLPMVRNLTGEITNRKLSKLKMSNLAKFPLSCQTTVISKYPLSTTSQNSKILWAENQRGLYRRNLFWISIFDIF